ncbi:coiled-coil domain-containing protein 93 isoform X2 [Nilaparvata lugens]|uniref:coiled-coil domain-containing protein 93 isoform X2 n=1 Tax=Nilaparvata lugens TaxID=108931 RepID=UPI00193E34A4|nr:coiled-coil domain-containing protein 93 isoform X2 [Nilaparvata lugens]
MAFTEAFKPKGSKHLSIIVDADGKEVQVEAREDVEQKVKLEEIINILYAAGYFRARIKGISAFDKVVGGMSWCIDSFDVDIDVDLLFQENLNIGQRISLTEKIVAVLPKMKCPYRIEPHQIQGLDFIHIYPVIQWLVKNSMERRKAIQRYYHSYALHKFKKKYTLPEDETDSTFKEKAGHNIANVQEKYRLQRKFRRSGPMPKDRAACVASTLYEYGMITSSKDFAAGEADAPTEVQPKQEVDAQQKQIASSMTSAPDQENRLTAGVVGNIVSIGAEEIARAVEHYTELQAETVVSGAAQKRQLEEKSLQLETETQQLEQQLNDANTRLENLRAVNSEEKNNARSLTESDQEILRKLQKLVTANENIKQQELAFREQCKTELTSLQNAIRDVEEVEGESDSERLGERQAVEQLAERVTLARLAVGKRTRAVASLQRQLDQVPSRTELAQYQRRFMELYGQVAAKHGETKKFYTLYNCLNDKHNYLKKELSILNSIQDSYTEAMASPAAMDQFMTQFEGILHGIQQNKRKVEQKLNDEKRQRDQLSSRLLALIELQRQYVSALKQLMAECQTESHRHTIPLQL